MPNISKSGFKSDFKHGIDLKSKGLDEGLKSAGVDKADVAKLDTNKDGVIKGGELSGAFSFVDGFDKNGSGSSFSNSGTAGALYGAFQGARKAGPYHGEAIKKAADDIVKKDADGYAYDASPTSQLKNLSGNKKPGTSRPGWLKNNNKCNIFVGNALTQAGVKMPTFTMSNGTEHYKNAERLPFDTKHFDRVTNFKDVKPGDVFVYDYPERGESTAHTEVITSSDGKGGLRSSGAHSDGAYDRDASSLWDGAKYDSEQRCWVKPDGDKIYLLRPTQKLNQ
jgi:hypothetical protein